MAHVLGDQQVLQQANIFLYLMHLKVHFSPVTNESASLFDQGLELKTSPLPETLP